VAKRGYTREQVYAEIAARELDVAAYITPQRRFADLVVRFYRPEGSGPDDEHLSVRIIERATLPRLNLEGVLRDSCEGFCLRHGDDEDETVLEIDGTIDPVAVRQLEDRIWEHFDAGHQHLRHPAPDQFGEFTDGVLRTHHSDPLALVQLLLVHRILSAKKSMLLKVPLSVHDEMIHARELRGETGYDHTHV